MKVSYMICHQHFTWFLVYRAGPATLTRWISGSGLLLPTTWVDPTTRLKNSHTGEKLLRMSFWTYVDKFVSDQVWDTWPGSLLLFFALHGPSLHVASRWSGGTTIAVYIHLIFMQCNQPSQLSRSLTLRWHWPKLSLTYFETKHVRHAHSTVCQIFAIVVTWRKFNPRISQSKCSQQG